VRHPSLALSLLLMCCSSVEDEAGETEPPPGQTDGSTSNEPEPGNETLETPESTTGTTHTDDGTTTGVGEDESSEGGQVDPGPDFRQHGPHAVQTETGQAALPTGCSMAHTRFVPEGIAPGGTVILAHGFQGNRASMVGWAEHLASWGLEVFTPDLCHATIFDSDHAQNGADLVALREHLRLREVVYAGYSAGGLAALVATADDRAALAVLGLDMVDNDGLGAAAAPGIVVPAHDIAAEPAMCNSSGNGIAAFEAAPSGRVLRVTEADHCDFQSPGDALCGLCSAANPTYDTATIQATIIGLSTAFALWQTQIDDSGSQWWSPGEPWFEQLAADGIVTVP
jgi:hypothetical protein